MNTRAEAAPVRVAGVTHRYRRHVALDDLTLTLPAGRLVGLIDLMAWANQRCLA